MERHEFEIAIKIGLGRIIPYLKTHDATPFRDIILYCCLHNLSHDSQVEGYKTRYIAEVIALTGELEFYREHIMNAAYAIDLQTDDFTKDQYHILILFHELALRGDIGARQFIYDAFLKHLAQKSTLFAHQIIKLDNVDGFIYVIENGRYDKYDQDYLLRTLEREIGKSEAQLQLSPKRLKNQKLNKVLESTFARRGQKNQQPHIKQSYTQRSYSTIKTIIENKQRDNFLRRWSHGATQAELIEAANDLLKTTDEEQLLMYLQIFRDTPFPLESI